MTPRSVVEALRWYVRELTGAAAYERYRARCPAGTALSRREYERRRAAHREHHPGSRCC